MYSRIRLVLLIALFCCLVSIAAINATVSADDLRHSIDTTLSSRQLGADGQQSPITTDLPYLDLTDALRDQIYELLKCEIPKVQCLCSLTHIERKDIYTAALVANNMVPSGRFRLVPPFEYNIQFHNLLSVSDETSAYALGAFAMRNVKNGKKVILAVEFRLSKTKQVDADGLLIKGTARWLEPVVGDWEHAWGYRLVEPLGSGKGKAEPFSAAIVSWRVAFAFECCRTGI